MIDTTTINYGMAKINEVLQKVAPSIEGLTEEYIHFVVGKTVAGFLLCLLLAIIGSVGLVNIGKKIDWDDWGDQLMVIPFGVLCCLVFVLSIATSIGFYESALALLYPKMFVIQQFIK